MLRPGFVVNQNLLRIGGTALRFPTTPRTEKQPDSVVVATLVPAVHGPAAACKEERSIANFAPVHTHVDQRASQARCPRGGGAGRFGDLLRGRLFESGLRGQDREYVRVRCVAQEVVVALAAYEV